MFIFIYVIIITNKMDDAIKASLEQFNIDNQQRLLTDSIYIKNVILPFSQYDYAIKNNINNNSDKILLPKKYIDYIYSFQNAQELNIFKIELEDSYIYGTLYDFIDDDIIYISDKLFEFFTDKYPLVKHGVEFKLTLSNHHLVNKNNVIIKPLTINFFDVKDQLKLFENIIGKEFRILYNHLTISIYSQEIQDIINFEIVIDNNINNNIIIKAIDVDLNIDFQPDEELVKKYQDKMKQRLENLTTRFKISTITKEDDDDIELTKEEVRQKRLEYYAKIKKQ
jgi:hypothetical protein